MYVVYSFGEHTFPFLYSEQSEKILVQPMGHSNSTALLTQTFEKLWHPGLLSKIRKTLPHAYYRTLESYLTERLFQVKFKDEITTLRKTEAGVPQGSVIGPVSPIS
jgi:hypothetical protein